MARAFGLTAHEQLTCGCHVHVEISPADEGVAVLDRIRSWLPVLLALSANSPFWQGRDSEYASFRYQAWGRWPSAGPTEAFGTAEVYRETVRRMVASGTLLDTGMVYFDARLSEHYPTLEIRIADVCLYAGDAVLIAALSRALVETEARRWRAGAGVQHQRIEILRLAGWRASRSGLDDVLLNPLTGRPEPAATVARTLLDHVRDALDEAGEAAAVSDLLTAVLARGNGAAFQRSACRDGGMADMIDSAATATTRLTIGGRYPHGGRYRALRRHGPVRRCGRRSGRFRAVRRGNHLAGRRAVCPPGAAPAPTPPHRIRGPPPLQALGAVRRWPGVRRPGTLSRSARWSRTRVTTPGEVGSHRCQVHSLLPAAECREALRYPASSGTVRQDLKCHFQAFEIVHRHQDSLGLPVPGQRYPLVLQPHPLR
jgi:carboxylate-amine ligase